MFWDIHVRSLEAQALEPLKALEEMRGLTYSEDEAVGVVVGRLNTIPEYRRLFAEAFAGQTPTAETLGKALAAFQRALTASSAPFDTTPRRVPSGPCQAISNGYRAAYRRATIPVTGGC
jgi:cytochrome c peroxidase